MACVTRGWDDTKSDVYAIHLQNRLPVICIPLRRTDADMNLDLQLLIDQVYENGSYGFDVDYTRPLMQPLPEREYGWAREWLAVKLSPDV